MFDGFVFREKTNRLDCYGEEKHLLIGKIKYPTLFGHKGRIGFMELYISHQINKRLALAKGSK